MIGSHGETGYGSNRYVRRPSPPHAIVFSSSDDSPSAGSYGAGFRPSPFITPEDFKASRQPFLSGTSLIADPQGEPSEYETGHLVMTYTALLCLSMLRDDFSKLDRPGLLRLVKACQQEDGR